MQFAKHETFHIRDGWISKGLRATEADGSIFLDERAPERLGLGKNMVRSLRYWMQATGLAHEQLQAGRKNQKLSSLGRALLQHDPYQEQEGTLWLLHHQLIGNRELAPSWYWFFNHFAPLNFTRQTFLERINQWLTTQMPDEQGLPAEGSLVKDFDCLVRTYVASDRNRTPEDALESPFVMLGLLSSLDQVDDDSKRIRHYQLRSTNATHISPLIFLYVLLSRQEIERPTARQVALSEVLRAPMNVGRTFNMGLQSIEDSLRRLDEFDSQLSVHLVRTGGLDQLTLPQITSHEVLDLFYSQVHAAEDVRTWSFPLS